MGLHVYHLCQRSRVYSTSLQLTLLTNQDMTHIQLWRYYVYAPATYAPLPWLLPPCMPPATHAPTCHTCGPCHACTMPCMPPCDAYPPPRPPRGQTDICEKHNFRKLRLLAVKLSMARESARYKTTTVSLVLKGRLQLKSIYGYSLCIWLLWVTGQNKFRIPNVPQDRKVK